MITAHLPGGYVSAQVANVRDRGVFLAVLLGSVLPDFDLIWFYFVDDRAFHHHHYWVHIPAFWLAVTIVTVLMVRLILPGKLPLVIGFLAGIAVHLLLDSIAGSVAWAWPFSDQLFEVVTVPATHENWIVSFLTHWTFGLELAIWVVAAMFFVRNRRRTRAPEATLR